MGPELSTAPSPPPHPFPFHRWGRGEGGAGWGWRVPPITLLCLGTPTPHIPTSWCLSPVGLACMCTYVFVTFLWICFVFLLTSPGNV